MQIFRTFFITATVIVSSSFLQNNVYAQCASATDCDGDLVSNYDDLDDDNDGILDSNEGYTPPSPVSISPVLFNTSLNVTSNAVSGNLVTITRNCLPDLTADFSFVSTGGGIPNLSTGAGDTRLGISYNPNLSGTAQVTYTFSEAVDVTIGFRRNQLNEAVSFITPYDNITPGAGSVIVSATYPVLWHNGNDPAYTEFEFLGVTSVVLELQGDGLTQHQQMSMEYLDNATCLDTDNDGIFDHQDLDSDNDGCPDAIEAGNTDPELDGILGTTPTIVNPANGMVTGTAVVSSYNGNQPDVLDSNTYIICSIILPVELMDFQIDCNNDVLIASWKTMSENDNSHFEIQGARGLSASINWETIASIKGANNSSVEKNYNLDFLNSEYSYFRLKQVDFSGKEEFSDVLFVDCLHDYRFLTVQLGTGNSDQFILINGERNSVIEIMDISGRSIFKEWTGLNDQPIKINISDFTTGAYIVKIGNQSQLFHK